MPDRKRPSAMDLFMPQAVMNTLKPPAHTMLKVVNPMYLAGKLNPTAKAIGRLFNPIMKPKKTVNWIRKQLTWENLQGPLSAVLAVVLGGLCAVLSQSSTGVSLSPATVISITTIVMEFGSTERFYIRSALRIFGTVIGAVIGYGFATAGLLIEHDLILQTYRLCIVALGGLITFVGMKVYADTSYAFMMFGSTMFSILYSITWMSALSTMLSALTGVMVSILTILIFQFPKGDHMLAQSHRCAVENLFTLIRFSIESDPRCMDDFDDCAAIVRRQLTSTSASFEVYAQWRRWTRRSVIKGYDSLSTATRPLFYLSYSMYWSLVESPSATAGGGQFFFCNHPQQYEKYFRPTRMMLEGAIMAIQGSLTRILVRDPHDTCPPQQHMDMIVSRHLWSGCMRNIHILKELYLTHREDCFSTFGQHWSVCDYINQLISLVIAITAYVHAIADVFMPEMAEHIYPMLEDICENLAHIRNEGGYRVDHFDHHVNPSRPTSQFTVDTNQSPLPGSTSYGRPLSSNIDYSQYNAFTVSPGMSRIPRGNQMDVDIMETPAARSVTDVEDYPLYAYAVPRGRAIESEDQPSEHSEGTPGRGDSRHRALSP